MTVRLTQRTKFSKPTMSYGFSTAILHGVTRIWCEDQTLFVDFDHGRMAFDFKYYQAIERVEDEP